MVKWRTHVGRVRGGGPGALILCGVTSWAGRWPNDRWELNNWRATCVRRQRPVGLPEPSAGLSCVRVLRLMCQPEDGHGLPLLIRGWLLDCCRVHYFGNRTHADVR